MSARRLSCDRIDLVTATAQHVLVQLEDDAKLARLLGAELPDDWPPPLLDETALRSTLDQLHQGPDQIGWWMRYMVLRAGPSGRPCLIGTVGLKGKPSNGEVEVGYSVVGSQQGHGHATEATSALVDWVFEQDDVERVVAQTRAELEASQRVLDKLGFVSDGPGSEPDAQRFIKTKEAWMAEGPPSRRVPKLVPPSEGEPIRGLPPVAREVFERLMAEPLRDVEDLRKEVRDYVVVIENAARENPYVDDILARDIARVCEGLFDAVNERTPAWARRQIQAAARYFVTEEDGDSDLAIGGLDEDAAVANAVAQHLGRGDLVSDLL